MAIVWLLIRRVIFLFLRANGLFLGCFAKKVVVWCDDRLGFRLVSSNYFDEGLFFDVASFFL